MAENEKKIVVCKTARRAHSQKSTAEVGIYCGNVWKKRTKIGKLALTTYSFLLKENICELFHFYIYKKIFFFLPVCMVIEIADKSDMQVTFFSQRVRKCLCELRCLCRPDLAPKKGQNKAFPFPLPLPPGKIIFSSVPGWMYPEPFQILELVRILGGEQMASEIKNKFLYYWILKI